MVDRVISEFNTAVGFTNRVNSLLWVADSAAMELDAYTWYHTLATLYREASVFMDAAELAEAEKKLLELTPFINNWQKRSGSLGFNKMDYAFYQLMHQFDLFLRKCLKDSGLLTKVSQDPSRAIAGGQ